MKIFVFFLFLFMASPLFAATGPTGFAVGFGTGVGGVDFSDGTSRTNIGAIDQHLELGIHIDDFAFVLEGEFMDFQGSLDDYVADGGFGIKWYFTENWHVKYHMGLSRFQRSANSFNLETITTDTGGSIGGVVGYDIYGAQGSSPFRLSVNVGSYRYDFGSAIVRQGNNTRSGDLANHVNGLSFFGYVGLDWYL